MEVNGVLSHTIRVRVKSHVAMTCPSQGMPAGGERREHDEDYDGDHAGYSGG